MSSIRIVLAGMPRLLRDIVVNAIVEQQDMHIVAELEQVDAAADATPLSGADLLVMCTMQDAMAAESARVLYAVPTLQVLTLANDGRTAERFELRLATHRVDPVSPSGIVQAIREAADDRVVLAPRPWSPGAEC